MIPGVGLFYGGMVRRKNAVSMISLSLISLALVSIQWVLLGYSLSFGPSMAGLIGAPSYLGFAGVGMNPIGSLVIPHLAYAVFQLAFAALTLAILTSAVAERVRIGSFMVFGLLWVTLVYSPLAHWVWGGGWLARLGAIDWAGGTVVHINSGFSALALALVIGRRIGFGEHSFAPHNVPMALLGAALVWIGWYGFNAGSALEASGLAANAFVTTNTAAAAGALGWMLVSWWHSGRISSLGIVSGAVAGLVAITPAAGYVDPLSSIVIGAVAGVVCYMAMLFRVRSGLDESLDAWAIHGIGGLWGAIATGIFATRGVNAYSGLLYGNAGQLVSQLVAASSAVAYTFTATLILAKLVDAAIGLRVTEEEEYVGLDISQHGEEAYA